MGEIAGRTRRATRAVQVVMVGTALYPASIFTGKATWLPSFVFALLLFANWRLRVSRRTASILGLLVAFFAMTAVAGDMGGTFGGQFLAGAALVIAVVPVVAQADREVLGKTLVALVVVEIGIAVLQFTGHFETPWHYQEPQYRAFSIGNELLGGSTPRVNGTLGHPLLLASLISLALVCVLRSDSVTGKRRLVLLGVFAVGICLTGSRSALVVSVLLIALATMKSFTFERVYWRSVTVGALMLLVWKFGLAESEVVERFAESGSLSHRQSLFEAIPRLLSGQSLSYILFGNGWSSANQLYDAGLLQNDYFRAVDNQWVATLVTSGLVGLLFLMSAMWLAFRVADTDLRVMMLAFGIEWFIFDTLFWTPTLLAFGMLFGVRTTRYRRD